MLFALAGSAVQAKLPVVQSDIFYEISQGNTKAIKAWLKSKPDVSIKNQQGQTLLHGAVLAENRSIIKMLVKAGVEVNALDNAGKTALDLSVESGLVKITYDLLKKKALIASVANEKPLKDLIVKRMTRLYKIFGGIFVVGLVLIVAGILLNAPIVVPQCVGLPGLSVMFMSIPGFLMGVVGVFGLASLGVTSTVRTHESYLLQ